MSRSNFAYIDRERLIANATAVKGCLKRNTKLCAVVKANAYGHDAGFCANALYPYADMFAVALLDEGTALRNAGIDKPILLLQPVLDEDAERAVIYGLTLTVDGLENLKTIENKARERGVCVSVHIKVNTGMNRFGINGFEELEELLSYCKDSPYISLEGIYSHFIEALNPDLTEKQYKLFLPYLKMAKERFPELISHISGSGGMLRGKQYHLDMVRIGILLYGYKPFEDDIEVRPVLSLKAFAMKSFFVERGELLGYGSFRENRGKDITLLRLGYADGFPRNGFGETNMLMDASFIEGRLDGETEIIGDSFSADEFAESLGTISYDILCNITKRSEFVFLR